MRLKELMSKHIIKINIGATVSKAAEFMDEKSIGSLLVEENVEIKGIITERDILRKVVAKGKDPSNVLMNEIMSCPLIKADVNTSLEDASEILERNNIRMLIITENNKIVGIITIRDINKNIKYLLGKRLREGYTTPRYRPSYGKP